MKKERRREVLNKLDQYTKPKDNIYTLSTLYKPLLAIHEQLISDEYRHVNGCDKHDTHNQQSIYR